MYIKKKKITCLVLVLFSMSLLVSNPVNALEYAINEDFEDSLTQEWFLTTSSFVNGYGAPPVEVKETNYTLHDGYLESSGEFNNNIDFGVDLEFNMAAIASNTNFGMWEVNASFPLLQGFGSPPITPGLTNFFIFISTFQPNDKVGDNVTGIHDAAILSVGFTHTHVEIDRTNNQLDNFELPSNLQTTDTWHLYQIIVTTTSLLIFVDSVFIGVLPFQSTKDSISVTFGSLHGTHTKFGDFRVSNDYKGSCKQLNYDCPGINNSTNSSIGVSFTLSLVILPLMYNAKRKSRT